MNHLGRASRLAGQIILRWELADLEQLPGVQVFDDLNTAKQAMSVPDEG